MIRLRPFCDADFPRLIGWIHSREMLIQWAGPAEFTFPLSEDQLARYLAAGTRERPSRRIFTATTDAGDVCGHLELNAISEENQTASLCRVNVAPEYRGKGVCTPMVQSVLEIGFGQLGLRRIDLRVYGFNTPGIRCYERAGFRREGLLRQSQRVGTELWDAVVMAILREEWERTHQSGGDASGADGGRTR